MTGDRPGELRLSTAQGRWVVLAAILGSALAGIDATVVNVALPTIGADLEADFTALQWTVTAYALTLAAFILTGGTLGDRFGRRRVFLVGVVWFAVASLACGLARSVEALVAARALQGVGGALLTPGSLALLQVLFRTKDRARAIGAWSGLGGVATAIGPLLGGWLVDVASWRWVFLVNVPLAAVVVVVTLRHVPETRDTAADGQPVDWVGSALAVLGLAGVTYALIRAGEPGGAPVVVATGVLGLVVLAGFVLHERRTPSPVLPPSVFRSRQLSAANLVTLLVYGGLGIVFFLLVLHLQVVAGFGPVAAGSALLPVTVVMLLLSSRSGALASRIGPRRQMTVGPLVAALGALLMLRIGEGASYAGDVLPAVLVFGLGLAALVAPLTATALAAAPPEHAGLASGVNNAVARTGGLVAVAAVPLVAGLAGSSYDDPDVFAAGFARAVVAAAVCLVLAGVVAALTVRDEVLQDEPQEVMEAVVAEPVVTHFSHCGVGSTPPTTSCDDVGRLDHRRPG